MTSPSPAGRTFSGSPTPRGDQLPILCMPYAGGNSRAYQSWTRLLPDSMPAYTAEPPGRERRFAEPMPDSIRELAAGIAADVVAMFRDPVVVFGHSMGALVAFEVARALRHWDRVPACLVVSGSRPPHLIYSERRYSDMSDEALGEWLVTVGGIDESVVGDPDLWELLLPVFRADLTLFDGYEYVPEHPLGCPLVVYSSTEDEGLDGEILDGWQRETTAGMQRRTFPGSHFYFEAWPRRFAADLAGRLQRFSGVWTRPQR